MITRWCLPWALPGEAVVFASPEFWPARCDGSSLDLLLGEKEFLRGVTPLHDPLPVPATGTCTLDATELRGLKSWMLTLSSS